jgi:hypothetical protein
MEAEVAINAVLDKFETLTPIPADELAPSPISARFLRAPAEQALAFTLTAAPRRVDSVSPYGFR